MVTIMPNKRSLKALKRRAEIYRIKQLTKKVFKEAFLDREKAEFVALNDYPDLNIFRGEVLRNPTYIHPSLLKLNGFGCSWQY